MRNKDENGDFTGEIANDGAGIVNVQKDGTSGITEGEITITGKQEGETKVTIHVTDSIRFSFTVEVEDAAGAGN